MNKSRWRKPGPTLYLGAGILAVIGFVGGIQADKLWGTDSGSSAAGAGAGAARTRASTGSAGDMTVGTVQKIDGKTIYLKTAAGQTVKVTTDGSTKVKVSKTGSAKDLKSGSTIVVQGSAGQNGTVTATTVNEGGSLGGGSRTGGPASGAGPVG